MKTFDLALIGWATTMSARARVISSLEALSRHCLGSLLHTPRAALVCEADECEVACGSLLRHDLQVMAFSFFLFYIGCVHLSYVEAEMYLI